MTHTGPPKRVIFGTHSVEIIYISTGNIIVKGTAKHASKAYEFSHLDLDPVPTPKRESRKMTGNPSDTQKGNTLVLCHAILPPLER